MTKTCKFIGLTSLAAISAAAVILLAAAADAHARSKSTNAREHTPHKHGKLDKFKAKTTGTVKAPPDPRHNPPRCPPDKSGC